jgi:DNA invertase Pin-like site-specific DNA recombinase
MQLSKPLVPKKPDGILRVIPPGRISKETQDKASIVSQQEDAASWLGRNYTKPTKMIPLGEQTSGWLANRQTMLEAQSIIIAGNCDLVLVGELREIYRNPEFQWSFVYECLDNRTRFISIWDGVDTDLENWEIAMHIALLRHGMTVPEARRRVRRKATHTFGQGGMVMKVKFGYRKLTKEEASSDYSDQ